MKPKLPDPSSPNSMNAGRLGPHRCNVRRPRQPGLRIGRGQPLEGCPAAAGLLASDNGQPFVLGEVTEVLGVKRRKRKIINQAGSYPGVVVRPGPPAQLCAGLELAPLVRHRFVVSQNPDTLTPPGQVGGAPRPPRSALKKAPGVSGFSAGLVFEDLG